MKISILIAAILTFCNLSADELSGFFSQSEKFFNKYVSDGRVDYSQLKKDPKEIDNLIGIIKDAQLSNLSTNTRKAFYINAYNLVVIHSIIQHYPVESPMDIDGFFDKQKHHIAGETLTLNELEQNKLIKTYQDPRLHFVLVCAAKSCPPIMNKAFTPEKIEEQMDTQTRKTINDSDWLKVNVKERKIEISKIFDWYKNDFTMKGSTVISWINTYRSSKIPSNYQVTFYEYDWSLNE